MIVFALINLWNLETWKFEILVQLLRHVSSVIDFKNGRLFFMELAASIQKLNFRVTADDVITRTFAKPELTSLIKLFHRLIHCTPNGYYYTLTLTYTLLYVKRSVSRLIFSWWKSEKKLAWAVEIWSTNW